MPDARRKRPHGEVSRQRILDAAAQIAGERGYEGTSINRVSERSGLPASSIYWHFKDKDELIAAVIDRSFGEWLEVVRAVTAEPGDSAEDRVRRATAATAEGLRRFPDFLRLGLMLILEQRPQEPTARGKFMEVRQVAAAGARGLFEAAFPDLAPQDWDALARLTLAMVDGLFIARDAEGSDLGDALDLMATALLGAADRMRM